MEAYKLWVRKHREFVHSLESLANGITWLLPERFSNSEIGPEAGEPSSFPWSLCVSTLKDLETVVEVAAQHFYGEDGKWNFIAVTEALKVMIRLALFRDSGYKMLLQGGEVANEQEKVRDVRGLHHALGGSSNRPGGYPGPANFQNYNGYIPQHLEGRAMSALNRFGENAKMASSTFWLNRFQQNMEAPATLMEKPTLSTIWSQKGLCGQLFVTGEVLCILRPLIYVLLIRKYGIRSWTPWLVSLAVDLTGMGIISRATSRGGGEEKYFQLSTSEKDEIKRRKLILALYVIRDPFFRKYTKHRLEKTDGYLSNVPFVGFLTGKLAELIVGAQTRYTYTSGS